MGLDRAAAPRSRWLIPDVFKASYPPGVRESSQGFPRSRQNVPDDLAMDVGQAEIAAGVTVGEPGVVKA